MNGVYVMNVIVCVCVYNEWGACHECNCVCVCVHSESTLYVAILSVVKSSNI